MSTSPPPTSPTVNPYLLEGLNAIVCGSSQGIGWSCAETMARLGARVTLVARNEEALVELRDELPADHGQTHDYVCADFSDWERVRDRITARVSAGPTVHILLNNTGGPPGGPGIDATPDQYMDAMRMHLACNQALVQAVVGGMRDARYGRIINVISTSVVTPIRGLGVSNATRGAVANWGRTLAHELGPYGITVNNLLPGFFGTKRLATLFQKKAERLGKTEQQIEEAAVATIPAGRLGRPDEIGAVAGFLASPAASYVNGVNLPVDGGRLSGQ